ncbi:ABC transporter substrate binding protein [Psychromonas sp. MME2]|uniref:ABC transporter substrate-binding protein n=1 Tax=unclassified Psychromonas TaxID=2614957 RepID=UPI00339C78CC
MKKVLCFALYIILLFFSFPIFAKQKILIIESYHSQHSWDQSYIEGIKSVLNDDFELIYFQINGKRIAKYQYQQQANLAWEFFEEKQPDLVILGDDIALLHLGERLNQTQTPVIYLGINNNPRNYNIYPSDNICGVLERPLIKRAIPTIAQVLAKKVNRVLLLFDNSTTSHVILNEVFANSTKIKVSSIEVEIKLIGNWEIWQEEINNADENNYDALFIGTYHTLTNDKGEHISEDTIINWSVNHTPIPPFAFWDFSVGEDKAIGGLVLVGFEQGKIAAEMAKEVLTTDKKMSLLRPRTAQRGQYIFSRHGLQKYGITLPEDIAAKATLID